MLITSNEYSNIFLSKKRLLLDSCVLNDIAIDEKTKTVLERAQKIYSFVYCTVSMLEVGFGPSHKAHEGQVELAGKIYSGENVVELDNIQNQIRELNNVVDQPGTIFSYNPNWHEWYAARHNLVKVMDLKNMGGKRARILSNDAIIFFSAWNSRSALISNNLTDFSLFNAVLSERNQKHLLPIFSLDDLARSLEEDICFPENLL